MHNPLVVGGDKLAGALLPFASHGKGAETFVDFDFGRSVSVAAFHHVQRRTPDTIAAANLLFSDAADFQRVLATVPLQHVDKPGATTFASFKPVAARYVRWQVTSVLPGRSPNVGGQGVEFFTAGEPEAAPRGIGIDARTVAIIERQGETPVQPLRVTLHYPYAQPVQAVVRVAGPEAADRAVGVRRPDAGLHGPGRRDRAEGGDCRGSRGRAGRLARCPSGRCAS